MNDPLCFLNDDFLPLSEARIPVLDRGFIFGDGVYDVVPVYAGKLFCFDAHLARLNRSLAKIRLPEPATREQWLQRCRHLVAQRSEVDQVVYIQVTRGPAPRDHVMPAVPRPTVFIMSNPLVAVPDAVRAQGVSCITASDFRWSRGDIKSTSLLGNVMARQLAADQGATETILLRDGWLTEASASNVWLVRDGCVLGPPKSEHVLEGIRFELLRQLCGDIGLGYELRPLTEADLRQADEVLLSSATKEVLPVGRLDGEPVGRDAWRGRAGPIYQRLYAAYQQAKLALCT